MRVIFIACGRGRCSQAKGKGKDTALSESREFPAAIGPACPYGHGGFRGRGCLGGGVRLHERSHLDIMDIEISCSRMFIVGHSRGRQSAVTTRGQEVRSTAERGEVSRVR